MNEETSELSVTIETKRIKKKKNEEERKNKHSKENEKMKD